MSVTFARKYSANDSQSGSFSLFAELVRVEFRSSPSIERREKNS
jgi:hypothetical protein